MSEPTTTIEYVLQEINGLPPEFERISYGACVELDGHFYDLSFAPHSPDSKWEAWSALDPEDESDKVGGGGRTPLDAILACQDWKAMLHGEGRHARRSEK